MKLVVAHNKSEWCMYAVSAWAEWNGKQTPHQAVEADPLEVGGDGRRPNSMAGAQWAAVRETMNKLFVHELVYN